MVFCGVRKKRYSTFEFDVFDDDKFRLRRKEITADFPAICLEVNFESCRGFGMNSLASYGRRYEYYGGSRYGRDEQLENLRRDPFSFPKPLLLLDKSRPARGVETRKAPNF